MRFIEEITQEDIEDLFNYLDFLKEKLLEENTDYGIESDQEIITKILNRINKIYVVPTSN